MNSLNFAKNLRQPSFVNTNDTLGLIMMQLNIRGMNRTEKLDSLCIILQNLTVAVDVLVIGETWLKEERSKYCNIQGFKSVHSCRSSSSGGLAIFVRDGLNVEVKKVTTEHGFHHIEIDVRLAKSIVKVHGIYRPPGYDIVASYDV